jgi:hypothetical protein
MSTFHYGNQDLNHKSITTRNNRNDLTTSFEEIKNITTRVIKLDQ